MKVSERLDFVISGQISSYNCWIRGKFWNHPVFAHLPLHIQAGLCRDQPSALAGIDRRLLLGSTVGSCRRLLLGSTVGFCWDRPQAAR
jgi:hypothetical protein